MEIHFITYGDSNYINSRNRICRESLETGVFKSCTVYTPENLNPNFKKKINALLSQSKGGGYWCWKPVCVLLTMYKIPENDWIFYADSGCSFVQERKGQILDLVQSMEKTDHTMMAYQMEHIEEKWTKTDMFHFFNVQDNQEITKSGQYHATAFFVRNTPRTRTIFKEMLSIMEKHPALIDDTPSTLDNSKGFREHRHDQSLFSIIRKINKDITLVVDDDTYYSSGFINGSRIRN